MGAGRAHFAHLPTLPISPIFSEFNPAQRNHAAHFAQIDQFLNCQVLFNVVALRAGNCPLTILFEHNGPLGLVLLSVLALRAGPF
jgi:hypothetical protein